MKYRIICKICLGTFETENSKKTCCSKQCGYKSNALNNTRHAKERKTARDSVPLNPCELCGIIPDKKHASGRFCSPKCSRSFSTSKNRDDISKKASESLRINYEKIVNSKDILPCTICGIIPITRHKSGRYCLDCVYKHLVNNSRKLHHAHIRKIWEAGDKLKECEVCGSLFQITWNSRIRKCCSDKCIRTINSDRMIQRNINGDFFQSFGHRVNYINNFLNIRCDSLIEWCFLEDYVNKHKDLIFSIARSSLRIPYNLNGKSRTYTPDFDITLRNGKKYIVECKSEQSGTSEIWVRYHNEANIKRKLLENYCAEQDLTFIWFTQKTRKDLYKKAQKLFKR